ncbi:MAG: TolC family protein [Candidatus Marinimicrobia bacterium]|nr:TolC family protein [Candidatus Neomarinimicrobiota bacterium]
MTLIKRSILCGLLIFSFAIAQAKTVSISFDELAEFSNRQSLMIQNIKEEFALRKTEKKLDLQWSNPTFNYSQEFVNKERDHYYTLNKQIEFPWVMAQRRKSWQSYLKSADYKKDEQIKNFISEIKSGYCEIKLLGFQLNHLKKIKDAIVNLSDVAQSQFQEGNLSGIEQDLIQMSLLQITVNQQEIERKLQSVRSMWKIKMGIDESINIFLPSDIIFQPIEITLVETYLSNIAHTSGYQHRIQMINAIQQRIKLEQKRIIPNFSVFGGSKQIANDQGYLAGISIPIPLLHRNKAEINRQKIKHQIANNELERYEQHLKSNVKTIIFTIENMKDWLDSLSENIINESTTIAGLLSAYDEGWMSLTEMLNAIQIHSDGTQQYYEQLDVYYQNIFQLEAITGETLVNFSPQGENNK